MNLTPENVLQFHKDTLKRVFVENYYPRVFLDQFKKDHKTPESMFEEYSSICDLEYICEFWNKFWAALPDNSAIRTGPFFDICDLAEGSYLETGDYEYEQTEDYRNSL